MKRQIRVNVFETNSSSVHSLVLLTRENYNKWVKNKIFHIRWSWGNLKKFGDWITKEELINLAKEEGYEGSLDDINELVHFFGGNIETYNSFGEDFEYFEESMTTPGGEEVIAMGYYGYDG